jgi:hypothetical protein
MKEVVKDDLATVLRRRASSLEADHGFAVGFTKAIRRAAEALEARAEFASLGEQAYLDAVADNRRLRSALVQTYNRLGASLMPKAEKHTLGAAIVAAVRACRAPGDGRVLIAIQIGEDETLDAVTRRTLSAIGEFYTTRGAEREQTNARDRKAKGYDEDRGEQGHDARAGDSRGEGEGPAGGAEGVDARPEAPTAEPERAADAGGFDRREPGDPKGED